MMDFYLNLFSLGSVIPLDVHIDLSLFERELESVRSSWHPYNPRKTGYNRFGLSLTSLDGGASGIPDLDSLREFNRLNQTNYHELDFRTRTAAYQKLSALHSVFEVFGKFVGRSHLLRFDRGGFFPPHRDGYDSTDACFRVFIPLSGCDPTRYAFTLDGVTLNLQRGQAVLIDTRRTHSVFSFSDGVISLVMNVELNSDSYALALRKLEAL
jgi:hypothetical protein